MDKEEFNKEVKTNISSLLVATKGAINPSQLSSTNFILHDSEHFIQNKFSLVFFRIEDYLSVLGCEIPHKKLGFSTLEEFLKSIPDVAKSSFISGNMRVEAVPSKDSAHILKLVQGQRKAKGKPKFFQNISYNKAKSRPPLLLHPPSPYHLSVNPSTKKNSSTLLSVPWSTPTFSRQMVPATRMKSSVFVPPHSTLNTVNSYGVVKPPAVPSAVFKIDKAAQYSTNHNTAPSNSVALSTKTTQPLRFVASELLPLFVN